MMSTEINTKRGILFIDDEELLLQCWDSLFSRMGCRVFTASDSKNAIEVFTAEKDDIDIIIIDYGLDDCSGFEVYQRLRNIKPNVKIIFTSAAHELPDYIRLPYGEIPPFIQKPFYCEELLDRVNSLYGIEFACRKKMLFNQVAP